MNSYWAAYSLEPVPTVREVLRHINRHGGDMCFFCKQQVRGDMPNHVKSCWLIWKLQKRTVSEKLAAIDRKENEEAWRKQAPKLGIHPDMHVKKSEREALGFFEEDRFV